MDCVSVMVQSAHPPSHKGIHNNAVTPLLQIQLPISIIEYNLVNFGEEGREAQGREREARKEGEGGKEGGRGRQGRREREARKEGEGGGARKEGEGGGQGRRGGRQGGGEGGTGEEGREVRRKMSDCFLLLCMYE